MHLNSWRAVGEMCRRRRPGGETHSLSVPNSTWTVCTESRLPPSVSCYFLYLFLLRFFSLRMAVQEDLDEEKRDQEDMNMQKAKRKKKN